MAASKHCVGYLARSNPIEFTAVQRLFTWFFLQLLAIFHRKKMTVGSRFGTMQFPGHQSMFLKTKFIFECVCVYLRSTSRNFWQIFLKFGSHIYFCIPFDKQLCRSKESNKMDPVLEANSPEKFGIGAPKRGFFKSPFSFSQNGRSRFTKLSARSWFCSLYGSICFVRSQNLLR